MTKSTVSPSVSTQAQQHYGTHLEPPQEKKRTNVPASLSPYTAETSAAKFFPQSNGSPTPFKKLQHKDVSYILEMNSNFTELEPEVALKKVKRISAIGKDGITLSMLRNPLSEGKEETLALFNDV